MISGRTLLCEHTPLRCFDTRVFLSYSPCSHRSCRYQVLALQFTPQRAVHRRPSFTTFTPSNLHHGKSRRPVLSWIRSLHASSIKSFPRFTMITHLTAFRQYCTVQRMKYAHIPSELLRSGPRRVTIEGQLTFGPYVYRTYRHGVFFQSCCVSAVFV